MEGYCKDHLKMSNTIVEIANDTKWMVEELKKINGRFTDHIEKGDKFYRPAIERNSAFRVMLMWLIGSGTVLGILFLIVKVLVR